MVKIAERSQLVEFATKVANGVWPLNDAFAALQSRILGVDIMNVVVVGDACRSRDVEESQRFVVPNATRGLDLDCVSPNQNQL